MKAPRLGLIRRLAALPSGLPLLAAALALLALCPVSRAGSVFIKKGGLVFKQTPQRALALDLYLPETSAEDTPPPLVVYIHGGSWQRGGAENVPFLHLLNEGFAIASLRYRFSFEARFPAQIEDVKDALAWLRAHGAACGADPSRTALIGVSAGGHLAMLAATTADEKTGPVRAVVSYFGPSDFLLRARTQPQMANFPGTGTYELLGGPPLERPELARAASPAFQVGPDAPPLLIFHGHADRVVLIDQSERMAEAYEAAGRPVTTHFKPKAIHRTSSFDDPESRAILINFLRQHLAP